MRRLLLLLLLATPALPQVGRFDAGTSNVLGSGGGAAVYFPNQLWYFGGGVDPQGRPVISVSDSFSNRGYRVVLGTNPNIGLMADGYGLALSEVGVSVERQGQNSSLLGFAGTIGNAFGTDWLNSTRPQRKFGTGFLYKKNVGRFVLSSLDIYDGRKFTLGAGAAFNGRKFKGSASGGILSGQRFIGGYGTYQPRESVSLYGSSQEYFLPFKATLQRVGAGWSPLSWLNIRANLNDSHTMKTTTGESVGASTRFGPVSIGSTYYRSPSASYIYHVVSERWRRFTVTENVTQGNHINFGISGSYTGNRLSISLNRSLMFQVNGYRETTSISVSIRIHSTVLRANSITDSFGRVIWSSSGQTIQRLGDAQVGIKTAATTFPYLIEGKCEQTDGTKVEGCVLEIGPKHDVVISDSNGRFECRQKKNQASAILVKTEDFLAQGRYMLISAPTTAKPGEPVVIIVARKL